MVKNHKISIDIRDISNDPFFHHYNFFKTNLTILSKLNNIFPESFELYVKELSTKTMSKTSSQATHKLVQKRQNQIDRLMKSLKEKPIWFFGINNDYLESLFSTYRGSLFFKENFIEYVRKALLVFLISKFELLIENNLVYVFGNIPSMLKSKDKTINYEELFSHQNFDSVIQFIITKEAKIIVSEDIEKINQILHDRYKIIDLRTKPDWKKFKECFYRRNLIIHNMSFVDELYRMKTGYNEKERMLYVDRKYLLESLKLFDKYSKIIHDGFTKKFNKIIQKQKN